MNRGDYFAFRNKNSHIDPTADNDVRVYAYKGQVYYRVGNGSPKLIGGQTVINNYIASQSALDNIRSGKQVIATAGSTNILFDLPLGTTGDDYNLYFFVRDADNAVPAFDVTNLTKYGFTAITYSDNVTFGWKAELNTQ